MPGEDPAWEAGGGNDGHKAWMLQNVKAMHINSLNDQAQGGSSALLSLK